MTNFTLAVTLIGSLLLAPHVAAGQSAAPTPERTVDRTFVITASIMAATTAFDIETTFAAISNGAHERNPVMRPFVKAGRPALYAVQGGLTAGILYASYRMKRSDNPTARKLWWLLPIAVSAGHGTAGTLNLRFAW